MGISWTKMVVLPLCRKYPNRDRRKALEVDERDQHRNPYRSRSDHMDWYRRDPEKDLDLVIEQLGSPALKPEHPLFYITKKTSNDRC